MGEQATFQVSGILKALYDSAVNGWTAADL